MIKKVLNYSLIGVVNTSISYLIIFALIYKEITVEISNFIGYAFGFFISYILNKKYNFKSENSHKHDLPKFIFFMFIAYIINLLALVVFYRFFQINPYLSVLLAGLVYTLCGFFFSNYFVFKPTEKRVF